MGRVESFFTSGGWGKGVFGDTFGSGFDGLDGAGFFGGAAGPGSPAASGLADLRCCFRISSADRLGWPVCPACSEPGVTAPTLVGGEGDGSAVPAGVSLPTGGTGATAGATGDMAAGASGPAPTVAGADVGADGPGPAAAFLLSVLSACRQ